MNGKDAAQRSMLLLEMQVYLTDGRGEELWAPRLVIDQDAEIFHWIGIAPEDRLITLFLSVLLS